MLPEHRPLILIDVDGVLNVWNGEPAARKKRREGWIQTRGESGGRSWPLLLNPAHGPLLLKLASDTGAELAWGTTWEHDANTQIGPHIGLPELPVAPLATNSLRRSKPAGIVPWTAGRPFVWFDDDDSVPGDCRALTRAQPHLVVPVDDKIGLTEEHAESARNWLQALP